MAITGAAGVIGSVVRAGLDGHQIVGLDLPECDLRTADLAQRFRGIDSVVHLAANTRSENAHMITFDPDNALMAFRVYEAAAAARTRRVVMASSVHTDRFRTWQGPRSSLAGRAALARLALRRREGVRRGAREVLREEQGFEVVCISFGGVNAADLEPELPDERSVWLTHADCVSVIRHCIEVECVPDRFALLYAVSARARPRVDAANSLGWQPAGR